MSIFLCAVVLLLVAICGLSLGRRLYERAAKRAIATLIAEVGPELRGAWRDWRDYLIRGTAAASAAELAAVGLEVADAIDPFTIASGWGDAMARWDTMFRVECERLGLRCSGPQYRAARARSQRVVQDRCFKAGAAAGPPTPPDDDLDATRDGDSSGVLS